MTIDELRATLVRKGSVGVLGGPPSDDLLASWFGRVRVALPAEGWPGGREIYWAPLNKHPANPEYVFQIGTEPLADFAWGDQGVGYFGRGTGAARDQWTFSWQCY